MTNNKTLSWGIYPGPVPESIEDFEKIITANPDYLAHFVHWGNGEGNLPSWLSKYAYDKGRTLVIFWECGASNRVVISNICRCCSGTGYIIFIWDFGLFG